MRQFLPNENHSLGREIVLNTSKSEQGATRENNDYIGWSEKAVLNI